MELNKYDSIDQLDTSTFHWKCRLRLQCSWKGLNKETKELWGINMIFIDDSNDRIHAFANAKFCQGELLDLSEGDIYIISNFKVKEFLGHETFRPVRNPKHIFFTTHTELKKDLQAGLTIEKFAFDLFHMGDVDKFADDNRFLIDMVGKLENLQPQIRSNMNESKTMLKFDLYDGRFRVNVTLFDEFGDKVEQLLKKVQVEDIYIIISCAKVGRYDAKPNITNYPATRVYINPDHYSVKELKTKMQEMSLLEIGTPENEVPKRVLTVKEIKELPTDFQESKVNCEVTVKKLEEKTNWYYAKCTNCEMELFGENGRFYCNNCTRIIPHPDKRFRLGTICSDHTGSVAIVFPDEEITRIIGKTVFDIQAECVEDSQMEDFPDILKQIKNQHYTITIEIKEQNIKKGSKVYEATEILEAQDFAGSVDPTKQTEIEIDQINDSEREKDLMTNDLTIETPDTGNSTSLKMRRLKNIHPVPYEGDENVKIKQLKKIKKEKI
ncbi:DUF223 domain-containing protein [Heracleum sosnowskyi]|uniref:DUF223 domain-containing protein n=1 Tax=Heracleum sosnowskyi TaxID=360622 RepID=A0AAD8JKJ8_9APIA|nr:DUF223 domain-containing protein [Heracleum sosnowskyi]